ncbi:MAG: rhodanese-like domain-containing protein [Cyclobacteriaceae bacterium]|nr:rhodanese-like domain-containing protein [Cyclobacteriaceae bacterium]
MKLEVNNRQAYRLGLVSSVFVDVREKDELERVSYDMPNVVNIPLSQFEHRFHLLSKEADLIVVCRTGRRSGIVTEFLHNKGYTNVRNLLGGIVQWEDDGLPVTRTEEKGLYERRPEAHPAFHDFLERIKSIIDF